MTGLREAHITGLAPAAADGAAMRLSAADAASSRRVTAVIAAYHSADVIGDLLATLPAEMQVVIVDGSRDPALAALAARTGLTIVTPDRNRGFGAAVNAGMAEVGTEFALVLNPDMLLRPGCVSACIDAADTVPDAGLLSVAGRGQVDDGVREADWAAGCFMMLRCDAFRSVNGFDDDYFLYSEDRDLGLRLGAAGHRVVTVGGARAHHVGGQSTGSEHDHTREKLWLWGGGAAVFIDKHRGDRHGAKVRSRLRSLGLRRYGQALIGRSEESRAARIRVNGAEAVRRHGPAIMTDNFFTGGRLRCAQTPAEMRVGEH